MILLDTHAIVWLVNKEPQLGATARGLADRALGQGELAVSAISFWELGMLSSRGRLSFEGSLESVRTRLTTAGLVELALDGPVAMQAVELEDLHADPADRFIVATARHYGATLVTADRRILVWKGELKRCDARV